MGRGFSRRVPGGWTMIESTTLRTLKGQGVWTELPGGQGWGPVLERPAHTRVRTWNSGLTSLGSNPGPARPSH